VIALGGITASNLSKVKDAGFDGAAVLGYVWNDFKKDLDLNKLVNRYKHLSACSQESLVH
jgi:thiamine-phosphate pyrophosphorylase